jgi:putative ABC transport system permease protein
MTGMKYFFLVWAGLRRRKTRTILTLLSAVTAFFLLGLLQGVDSSIRHLVDVAHLDRLYVVGASLQPLPLAYLEEIDKVPGVTLVTHAEAALGSWRAPRNTVAFYVVDPARYFDMVPEVVAGPAARAAMRQERLSAIVAAPLARRFGWKIGDRITIHATAMPRADGSADWPVVIAGFANYTTAPDTPMLLLNFDYFDAARLKNRGTTQRYIVKITDPARAAEVSAAIDRLFLNAPVPTRTETEKAFAQDTMSQIGDVDLLVAAIMGAVFFTLLLLVGNAMMQSFRERVREFAILKSIGFTDRRVAALVISEALMLCGLAGVLGLLLARITLPVLGRASGGFVSTQLSGSVAGAVMGAVLLVSMTTALVPALKARRLGIAEALMAH